MTMQLYTSQNHPITLTDSLGKGGEATVYQVAKYPAMVAKLYHQPTAVHEAKLRAMIANPPQQPATHIAIAWPTELLYQQGQFVGFLMPKVTQHQPIFEVYNPTKRAKMFPQFTLAHLLRTASNLAAATHAVHSAGHVVGDMNESNLLVNAETLITLVDTDSFQIMTPNQQVYRCGVGKAEYTPPELQKMNFKDVTRRVEHDNFGLAVLIFQLLMQGFHPFAGTLLSEQSVGRVDLYAIQQGIFPYSETQAMKPPRGAPNFAHLPPHLQLLFERCFVTGYSKPLQRPDAAEWARALYQAESAIITCRRDSHHLYFNHLEMCPECKVMPLPVKTRSETPTIFTPLTGPSTRVKVVLPLLSGLYGFAWVAFLWTMSLVNFISTTPLSMIGMLGLSGGTIALGVGIALTLMVGVMMWAISAETYRFLTLAPQLVTITSDLTLPQLTQRVNDLLARSSNDWSLSSMVNSLFAAPTPRYEGHLDGNYLTMKIKKGSGKQQIRLETEGVLEATAHGSLINLKVEPDSEHGIWLFFLLLFPLAIPFVFLSVIFIQDQISSAMRELSKALDGTIVDTKKLGQGNG